MTTEGRKRLLKPLINNFTKAVIVCIPFLNARDEKELIESMIEPIQMFWPLSQHPPMEHQIKALVSPWEDDENIIKTLKAGQGNLRKILSWEIDKPDPHDKRLKSWLEELLRDCLIFEVCVDSCGFSIGPEVRTFEEKAGKEAFDKAGKEAFDKAWPRGFLAKLAKAIHDSFTNSGNGPFFVGLCPRCETVFEKKNNRQAFCRDYCQKNPAAKPRKTQNMA